MDLLKMLLPFKDTVSQSEALATKHRGSNCAAAIIEYDPPLTWAAGHTDCFFYSKYNQVGDKRIES